MTNHVTWSRDERERAQKLVDLDARQLNCGMNPGTRTVPLDVCAGWRRELQDEDSRPGGIDGHGFADSTIRKHASGLCDHDVGVPALEYDSEVWQS